MEAIAQQLKQMSDALTFDLVGRVFSLPSGNIIKAVNVKPDSDARGLLIDCQYVSLLTRRGWQGAEGGVMLSPGFIAAHCAQITKG